MHLGKNIRGSGRTRALVFSENLTSPRNMFLILFLNWQCVLLGSFDILKTQETQSDQLD